MVTSKQSAVDGLDIDGLQVTIITTDGQVLMGLNYQELAVQILKVRLMVTSWWSTGDNLYFDSLQLIIKTVNSQVLMDLNIKD